VLTPETSIKAQRELGADIILTLDECTPFHVDKRYTEQSMERSHRWELRSLAEFIRGDDGKQVRGAEAQRLGKRWLGTIL
jgi:queuine tRNA-ribosyltransferase